MEDRSVSERVRPLDEFLAKAAALFRLVKEEVPDLEKLIAVEVPWSQFVRLLDPATNIDEMLEGLRGLAATLHVTPELLLAMAYAVQRHSDYRINPTRARQSIDLAHEVLGTDSEEVARVRDRLHALIHLATLGLASCERFITLYSVSAVARLTQDVASALASELESVAREARHAMGIPGPGSPISPRTENTIRSLKAVLEIVVLNVPPNRRTAYRSYEAHEGGKKGERMDSRQSKLASTDASATYKELRLGAVEFIAEVRRIQTERSSGSDQSP